MWDTAICSMMGELAYQQECARNGVEPISLPRFTPVEQDSDNSPLWLAVAILFGVAISD